MELDDKGYVLPLIDGPKAGQTIRVTKDCLLQGHFNIPAIKSDEDSLPVTFKHRMIEPLPNPAFPSYENHTYQIHKIDKGNGCRGWIGSEGPFGDFLCIIALAKFSHHESGDMIIFDEVTPERKENRKYSADYLIKEKRRWPCINHK